MATSKTYDENWTKKKLKKLLDDHGALHVPIPATGMGVSGVSDRLACVKGIFLAIEAKRPGRRGESNRGCSALQAKFLNDVAAHHGVAVVFDGEDDDVCFLTNVLEDIINWRGHNNLNDLYWKK